MLGTKRSSLSWTTKEPIKNSRTSDGESEVHTNQVRMAAARLAETPEQRQKRAQANKVRMAAARLADTPEQRQQRAETNKERMAAARLAETLEQRQQRAQTNKVRMAAARLAETPEQLQQRVQTIQFRIAAARQTETPEQRLQRSQTSQVRMAAARQTVTPEQSQQRVQTNQVCIQQATILSGNFHGQDVFIPRIPIIPSDLPFQFKRVQFPVRLSFSMSINKAQGQFLKVVGLNLQNPCFSRGQLYVGCSRVSSEKGLYILAQDGRTKNIVYKEAL